MNHKNGNYEMTLQIILRLFCYLVVATFSMIRCHYNPLQNSKGSNLSFKKIESIFFVPYCQSIRAAFRTARMLLCYTGFELAVRYVQTKDGKIYLIKR